MFLSDALPNRRTYRRLISALLSLTCFTASPVHADSTESDAFANGWYATALFGLTSQSDQQLRLEGNGPVQNREVQLDRGGLAGGALGWQFANGWRLEGEFVYQSVDLNDPGFVAPAPRGDGNYASTSVALNALYSLDLFGSPRVRTYVGAGLVRLTEVDIDFESAGRELGFSNSDNGVQLLFGARYRWGERAFVDAGVRWLKVSSLTLEGEDGAIGSIRADYEPWAVTLGVGWMF